MFIECGYAVVWDLGIISDDPGFCGPVTGHFRLCDGYCIDAGDNTSVLLDLPDPDNDDNATEQIPRDIDNNPRFIDDAKTDDTEMESRELSTWVHGNGCKNKV